MVDAEQARAPAPLEDRGEHAVRRADAQQVHHGGLHRDDDRSGTSRSAAASTPTTNADDDPDPLGEHPRRCRRTSRRAAGDLDAVGHTSGAQVGDQRGRRRVVVGPVVGSRGRRARSAPSGDSTGSITWRRRRSRQLGDQLGQAAVRDGAEVGDDEVGAVGAGAERRRRSGRRPARRAAGGAASPSLSGQVRMSRAGAASGAAAPSTPSDHGSGRRRPGRPSARLSRDGVRLGRRLLPGAGAAYARGARAGGRPASKRRDQRQRGGHHGDDGDRGGVAEGRVGREAGEAEAQQRDEHGGAGEDDRPAGGGARAGRGLAHVEALTR